MGVTSNPLYNIYQAIKRLTMKNDEPFYCVLKKTGNIYFSMY